MQRTSVNLLKELYCTRTQCISCPLNIVYIHSTTSLWEKETHAAAERKRWSSLYHFISRQKYYFSNHQPAEVKGMSDSRESKIYYRHFSDRYTIWNFTVFFCIVEIVVHQVSQEFRHLLKKFSSSDFPKQICIRHILSSLVFFYTP